MAIPRRTTKPRPDSPTVDTPGLEVKRLVDKGGNTPAGSTGYVYLCGDWDWDTGLCTVAAVETRARFWPACYDPKQDLYIKLGPGEQMDQGVVIETFP